MIPLPLVQQIDAAWTKILPKGKFARGISQLSLGTACSQVAILSAMPVLTRLYTPEEFGVLGVFSTVLGLLTVVSSLRYEMAITLPVRDSAAFQVLGLCFLCLTVSILVVAASGSGAGQWLLLNLGAEEIIPYYWLVPVGGALAGLYQILTYWAVRRKAYGVLALTRIQQGFSCIIVQAVLGVMQIGGLGLLVGHIIGQGAGVLRLARNTAADYFRQRPRVDLPRLKWAARRYIEFPRYDSWAALLNTASAGLPIVLFAFLFGPKLVGFYALTLRLLSAPIALFGKSLSQVLLPHATEAGRSNNLPTLVARVLRILTVTSLTPFFLVAIVSPRLFGDVFGSEWVAAGEIASYTSLWVAWQFIYSPLSTILLAVEAQRTNLVIQGVSFVLRALAIAIGYIQGSEHLAVCYFSATSIATYLFALVLVFRCSGADTRKLISVMLLELVVASVSVGPLFLIRHGHSWMIGLVFIITACVWAYRLKREMMNSKIPGLA